MQPPGGRQSWPPNGPTPPSKPSRMPWILIGISLSAVLALVVGVLVWQGTSARGPGSSGPIGSTIGDDRSVRMLSEEDPVCDGWTGAADKLAKVQESWTSTDRSTSATDWTPEQRAVIESVGSAMTSAADEFEVLLPRAEHIVLRELIAQTIVYLRLFVERIPSYVEVDSRIAGVAGNFSGAVTYMCSAVPLVPTTSGRVELAESHVADPNSLVPFITHRDIACERLVGLFDRQNAVLRGWAATDSSIPAAHWSAEQETLNRAARTVISGDVAEVQEVAAATDNGLMQDLLNAQALYMSAFADAIPTYAPDDAQLWSVATYLGGGLSAACKVEL